MVYNQWTTELMVSIQFSNWKLKKLSNILTNEVTSTHHAERNELCLGIHCKKQREEGHHSKLLLLPFSSLQCLTSGHVKYIKLLCRHGRKSNFINELFEDFYNVFFKQLSSFSNRENTKYYCFSKKNYKIINELLMNF